MDNEKQKCLICGTLCLAGTRPECPDCQLDRTALRQSINLADADYLTFPPETDKFLSHAAALIRAYDKRIEGRKNGK